MELKNIPVQDPRPDSAEFIDIILGRAKQVRTPLVEYIVDDVVMQPIVEDLLGREWVTPADPESRAAHLDNFIEFWLRMGYDHVRFEEGLPFSEHSVVADDPAPATFADGLAVQAVLDAIRTSSAERRWVDVQTCSDPVTPLDRSG